MGKVIQDVATAYREDLVPPAEPVSESWEAGNPHDHPSHEPQEEEESDEEQTSSAIPTHILAPQAQDQTFSENPGDHQVTGTVVTVANALPDHNLFYPRPMLPRAPLPRYPPIWAESRQEVCESFDWFRSYQGGVYFMKGQVKGYLLGGFSASRDLFHNDGRLIISHGGGKAESIHKHNGLLETLEASDQMEEDKSVRALLGVYRTKRPVALLIDENYKLFPYDLSSKGCTYAVLGWYYIAHAWAEYQFASNTVGRVVRYKFAFQWCESQGQPWWMFSSPEDTFNLSHGSPSSTNSMPPVDELTICMENMTVNTLSDPESHRTCQLCGYSSPTVYEQGWMCLQPDCPLFWRRENGEEAPAYLTYSQVFLRPVPLLGESLQSIYPSPPGIEQPSGDVTTTRRFCKGWHCSKCGRLSSRYKWEHWECRHIQATYGGHGRFRFAYEFKHQTTDKNWGQYWYHEEIIKPLCVLFRSGDTFGTRSTFILPHGRGRIHMLTMNPRGNRLADEIFVQYQDEAKDGRLRFRRWPMRAHKCRGTLLTNYFSQNTGEPYQYVGGSENTVPFDQSPKAVVKALNLIHARIREASIELQNPFNEILSAAYMEEQKMAFHSDSERGLGPVVASLSLGASACMYFRLHARYAFDEMPDENPLVLKLFLRHGDVVVMEGAGVQTCYEHTVVPLNFRIAATARYIGSDHQ
ncbi:hypothetical protein NM688_g5149 [Phlebia brevispora]|uniref:Uncharacterized protein n=1 Tax=Phlebia brevispora TaxID=194682 RepID=A0ACC1T0H2_9APHY|nr:hypothetical protein NM688_g5149 [Phlebia brevispora]